MACVAFTHMYGEFGYASFIKALSSIRRAAGEFMENFKTLKR